MSGVSSRRRFLKIAAVQTAALAALGGAVGRAQPELRPQRWRGIALGGEVGIDLYGGGGGETIFEKCRLEMLRLEGIFSLYLDDSELARLNRLGRLEEASEEFIHVLRMGQRTSAATHGAFDVTVHPLCELLSQGETNQQRLRVVRELVDYRKLMIDGRTVRLAQRGMAVTLNGIAQGFITDRITELLAADGFTTALVDLGEKRALGIHPEQRPWRVGVRSTEGEGTRLAGVLDLAAGRAIATSGGYGQRYQAAGLHHLLDARSGESRAAWTSVSVIADDAVSADALSTALSVSAPQAAEEILGQFAAVRPLAKVFTRDGAWVSIGSA